MINVNLNGLTEKNQYGMKENKMKKTITIYEGEVDNVRENYSEDLCIGDDRIDTIFHGFLGKNIRVTIEEIEGE